MCHVLHMNKDIRDINIIRHASAATGSKPYYEKHNEPQSIEFGHDLFIFVILYYWDLNVFNRLSVDVIFSPTHIIEG